MSEKFLGDYIDEFLENTEKLSKADLCAVASGICNIVVRRHPQDFIDWAQPLISRPADRGRHPHHDILSAQIREANDRIVELKREANKD